MAGGTETTASPPLTAASRRRRSLVSPHLVIAGDSTVVGLRGQHHVQLGLVSPSLALVASVERQAQRVVVAKDDFLPAPVDAIREGERERQVSTSGVNRQVGLTLMLKENK